MTDSWESRLHSVTVRKPTIRDELIFDIEASKVNKAGLPKPLEDCDTWLDLAPPAVSVERTRPWSPKLALGRMAVTVVQFDEESHPKWTKGYAAGNKLAIRPDSDKPLRNLCHELAHIALRHTYLPDPLGRDPEDPIREVQAEASAYLVQTYAGAATAEIHASARVYNWRHTLSAGRWMTKVERDQCFEAAELVITAGRPDNRPVILERHHKP